MRRLEPTYLRHVYDQLSKGSISSDNSSSLPYGFVGIFEKEFSSDISSVERSQTLKRLCLWALFKRPVSTLFFSKLLNEDEELSKGLIDIYSNWFNSPEPGKYVLFHDRLRAFLLQKLSNHEVKELNEQIISYLEVSLGDSLGDESESYALEYLSHHMLVESQMDNNYDRLINYTNDKNIWSKQISLSSEYKWSQKGLNDSIKESARRHLELDTLKSTVNSVKLNLDEKNSSKEILNLLYNEDYNTALSRALAFEGENLIVIYLIMIHELTIGSLSESKSRDDALKEIINSISDNTGGLVPDWYPGILILQYQIKLKKLELILFEDEKKNEQYDTTGVRGIVFLKNKIYEDFWPLVIDDNFNYIDTKIKEIPQYNLEGQFMSYDYDLASYYLKTKQGNSIFDMLSEIKMSAFGMDYGRAKRVIHINNFNDFNFQEFNLNKLVPHPYPNYLEQELQAYLYCAYRYLKLEDEFLGFKDKKTSKMINSKEDAALMCFNKAFQIVCFLEEKDFNQELRMFSNLKAEYILLIIRIIKLFPSKKNDDFKKTLYQDIEQSPLYIKFDNKEIINELFKEFLSQKEYKKCIDINNKMSFDDSIALEFGGDGLIDSKANNLYELLKVLIRDKEEEMYDYVYEMLPDDFWRCKIELYGIELLYKDKDDSGLRNEIYNIYNKGVVYYNKKIGETAQRVYEILFKYDIEAAQKILENWNETIDSVKDYQWKSNQYIKIFITMKEKNLDEESKEYFEKSLNSIKQIKNINIKRSCYVDLLKALLKFSDYQSIDSLIKNHFVKMDKFIFGYIYLYNKELALKYAEDYNLIIDDYENIFHTLSLDELFYFSSKSKTSKSKLNLFIINEIANNNDLLISELQKTFSFDRSKLILSSSKDLNTLISQNEVDLNKDILNILLYKNSKNKTKSLDYINLFLNSINKIVYRTFSDLKGFNMRVTEMSANKNMDIVIADFLLIKYLYNSLSFKNKTESRNNYNISLIEEIIKNVKSINPLFDSRVLGNQKIRILLWLIKKLYHHGYIEESFELIGYAEKTDTEIREKNRASRSLKFQIYSILLLLKFSQNPKNKFTEITDELELYSDKLDDSEKKYYFMLQIVLCLIHSNNISQALNSMKKQLEEIYSYPDFEENPYKSICVGGDDLREHLLNEYINIVKKISGGLNENPKVSVLKIDSKTNKITTRHAGAPETDLIVGGRFDEKYNEQSIIKECERLINKDFSNFDLKKYLESHKELDFSIIEGFDKEILFYNNLKFNYSKTIVHSVILKDIEYENLLNKEIESESSEIDQIDSLNYLYKIDKKYLKSKDILTRAYLTKSKSKKNEYDFLELSDWDDNSIFPLHINSIPSYTKKIIILFYYAKIVCFFEDNNKSENKIDLLKQAIDFDEWIQLSSKL